MALLVVLFVVAGGASALYVRAQAEGDAERAAQEDAAFAAKLAASEVAAALGQFETTLARTAPNPGIVALLDSPAPACNFAFSGVGIFQKTHLDLISSNGALVCSSAGPAPAGLSYRDAGWFARALTSSGTTAPFTDPRTGRPSLVVTAPVAGRGVLAAFADLTDVGPVLASRFGGARHLEILLTTADGKTALARSSDPERWAGASLDGTPFAATADAARPDVDGTPRLYADAAVGTQSWKIYAGADRSAALSAATSLFTREIAITAVGLLVVFAGVFFIYRRVVTPIAALGRSVGAASSSNVRAVNIKGPREIVALSQDFNRLIGAVQTELAERQRAEARIRGMIDEALDAVVGMNQQGEIIEWSHHAEQMFGWRRDEVLGNPLVSLIIPERYRAAHIAGLERFRRTGVGPVLGKRLELEALARDGREFPIELSITPITTPTGTVFSAFIRDLTDRVNAARQRKLLEGQLQQAQRLESVGQLAGGVAHDFNNLIAVILNYATFVSDDLGDRPALKDDVEQIKRAAERAAALTRQLLIFSRREVSRPEILDLSAVVSEMKKLLVRTIGENIELVTRVDPDLWPVVVDRGQIEQVLMNLAVNARDAMNQGGRLVIEARNVDLGEDFVKTHIESQTGRHVRLSVSDTGQGMIAEVREHAFEPFFTTKPKGEGTGLGLATVYGIVSQAGGTVELVSEVGKGTSVVVHLAASETDTQAASPEQPSDKPRGEGQTVLLVEDEAGVRSAAKRILIRDGYLVLEAPTPADAIRLGTEPSSDIDLLLTDVVMPGMSGMDVARRIQAIRSIPVLYMSGYPQDVIAQQGLAADQVRLLEKPFTRDALLRSVQEALGSKR
jgi:PAS domain S-box-containing protein